MKIDSKLVKELRDRTGAGILACKKALEKADGDIEGAIDILRAEGIAKAAKRENKEAREGVIRLKINSEGKKGALLELNCETDFVTRTDDFNGLADEMMEILFSDGPDGLSREDVREKITAAAAKIGEKITIGRSLLWEKDEYIGGYLHHNGRVAALVELSENLPKPGREIAMQVAASNPPYLSVTDIPSDEEEREMAIFREQIKDKPEAIQDKILTGKWRKRLTELCLLNFPFLLEDKISVEDYLNKQDSPSGEPVKIKNFVRWELGGK
ncbi:MAG: translation elongation factor Ts [Candidatus Auribacterota bacterium]|nr:translation elongation factor Ts [Candidatus Auribacterota bacterium]